MARMILALSAKTRIQYKDKNFLNNQKSNIRVAEAFLICRNSTGHRDGTSKYKGVSWEKATKKWRAQLQLRGRKYNIGRFTSEEEAAKAYDEKVREICGTGIYWLNFPL